MLINRLITSMTTKAAFWYALVVGIIVFVATMAFSSVRHGSNLASTLVFDALVGLFVATLFSLLIFQMLVNGVRALELHKKSTQLNTLFQNLPGAAYRVLVNAKTTTEKKVEFF